MLIAYVSFLHILVTFVEYELQVSHAHIFAIFETQKLFHKYCANTSVMYCCTEVHKPGFSGSLVKTVKIEAKENVCTAALCLPYVRIRCSL